MKIRDLEILGNWALSQDTAPIDCDADDLVNALLVLQGVAHSLSWRHYSDLNFEQRSILAIEFGQNLRQSITLFTGIDPADAVGGNAGWDDVLEYV